MTIKPISRILSVREENKEVRKVKLLNKFCQCKESEFLCYPEDGQCECKLYKHHVHCANCFGISQIG